MANKTVEIEGKGLDYERFALDKLFKRLLRQYPIGNILEIPAKGEKAMPSLYSLAFAACGAEVTLVNAEPKSKPVWRELNLPVSYHECGDLHQSALPAHHYDLVWNFMQLAKDDKPASLLAEMSRLSKQYVLYIGVNRFNPGFFSHRLVHRYFKEPWTHGDVFFMNPFHVRRYFQQNGLQVVEMGLVDTPPFPDSMGIRDMKLHRKKTDLNTIDWQSRTVEWMKTDQYPLKLKFYYCFEWLPLPFVIKMFYAHLFFVLAEKTPG